jgi:inner membrane protein
MMAVTPAAISAAAVGLSLSTVDPGVLAVTIAASQIPDIDTSTSSIGQILWPISRWIEKRYPQRSVTHSLIFTAALGFISCGLWWRYDVKLAIALPLGHLVACFSDTFIKAGVQLSTLSNGKVGLRGARGALFDLRSGFFFIFSLVF